MSFTFNGVAQIIVYFLLLLLITKPLGLYLTAVFEGKHTWLTPVLQPIERAIYAISGVDERRGQDWKIYTVAMLIFEVISAVPLYLLERLQNHLPLNPAGHGSVDPLLAWNTAISFMTNTNWQNYSGENTMSYLTQMAGLAFHNFVSAAVGIAIAVAVIRGFTRRSANNLGNFWVDVTRCCLYILLPFAFVLALVFVWQGVPQNFNAYAHITGVQGFAQTIAQGPVASQEVIKMMGTNGGGFFNANSAHPFENPTPFTNLLEMLSIFMWGAALIYMFGKLSGNTRNGWALFGAVSLIFLLGAFICLGAEQAGNPQLAHLGLDQTPHEYALSQPGGNMEGKELRFGIGSSTLFTTITTDASCGAINSWLDSYTPIGGMIPLVNIQLGEIIFGGVGSGMYGLLVFAVLAVFIAGLMVGRTPEFLGKKIEQHEMKMAALAILILPASILGFTAIAIVLGPGVSAIANPGPHGLTEVLYAFSSQTGNNGSAFAGLGTTTVGTPSFTLYNWTGAFAMLIGRFAFLIPVLALAGSLAPKKIVPVGPGTFPTTTPLFAGLVDGVIVIVGALTFFPALALGPIVEQLLALAGKTF
ncbi:MAG TPA: potassium-transporting ATPase subunit KdpA [Ktedonobacterales bacterium]|jgi:K+-transporting ATPase ATPase A chain|nr:potassium-transporting ATPase subunit KdpA [Ktedonobacterales bacterium]